MDLDKIFIKNCSPTKCGGQAVMEGVMMRGSDREAITVRLPDGRMRMKISPIAKAPAWKKIPIVRGVVAFVISLVSGTKTLLWSADVLEEDLSGTGAEADGKDGDELPAFLVKAFGEKGAWNVMLYSSVLLSLVLTVVIFVLGPTWVVNILKRVTDNVILLNLAESLVRVAVFLVYLAAISRMKEIRRVFQYHGAEHKTIHCYENGLELTPANARGFLTLHPRCGTSFLVFTILIALIVHAFFGWPTLWLRIATRLLCLPVVAGLSYELLQWAGRSDNALVKFLSVPGLATQKITTKEPDDSMLEVAICSLKAVTDPDAPAVFDGFVTTDGVYTPLEAKEPA
jgi:uncharacterized protein YqhQ